MDKTQVLLRLQSVLTPAARPAAAGVIYMGEGALYQVLFIDHHKSQQKLFEIHIIHLTEKKSGGQGGLQVRPSSWTPKFKSKHFGSGTRASWVLGELFNNRATAPPTNGASAQIPSKILFPKDMENCILKPEPDLSRKTDEIKTDTFSGVSCMCLTVSVPYLLCRHTLCFLRELVGMCVSFYLWSLACKYSCVFHGIRSNFALKNVLN